MTAKELLEKKGYMVRLKMEHGMYFVRVIDPIKNIATVLKADYEKGLIKVAGLDKIAAEYPDISELKTQKFSAWNGVGKAFEKTGKSMRKALGLKPNNNAKIVPTIED